MLSVYILQLFMRKISFQFTADRNFAFSVMELLVSLLMCYYLRVTHFVILHKKTSLKMLSQTHQFFSSATEKIITFTCSLPIGTCT